MLFTDLIRKKRDGEALDADEIAYFVSGLADESIPAEQVSALAMAIYLNSMCAEESGQLTMAMAASGVMLDWQREGLDGPVVDKHSSGGVGDKVSFILAPVAAACGCYVPMISGRGLGHTGGTTDKVESIPGYRSTPDFDRFRKVVKEVGCAIIGQTEDLAPADRRFYAIRDVTSTVESVPLITASILSKKIAAGLDALVMDVKTGNGAFMATMDRAEALSSALVATAASANLKTHAIITDMNECLGSTAGNALEIAECVEFLKNNFREERLDKVVVALCAEMLIASGLESDREAAARKVNDAIVSGKAADTFGKMIHGMGGPADFIENYKAYLPQAKIVRPILSSTSGFVDSVNAFQLGNAIIELGGGRRILNEALDLSVGMSDVVAVGAAIEAGQSLMSVHAATEQQADAAEAIILNAYAISEVAPDERPVIYQTITGE